MNVPNPSQFKQSPIDRFHGNKINSQNFEFSNPSELQCFFFFFSSICTRKKKNKIKLSRCLKGEKEDDMINAPIIERN